jgi:quinoprotein glucose dehydrogenase
VAAAEEGATRARGAAGPAVTTDAGGEGESAVSLAGQVFADLESGGVDSAAVEQTVGEQAAPYSADAPPAAAAATAAPAAASAAAATTNTAPTATQATAAANTAAETVASSRRAQIMAEGLASVFTRKKANFRSDVVLHYAPPPQVAPTRC